jgi:hypothetical protein
LPRHMSLRYTRTIRTRVLIHWTAMASQHCDAIAGSPVYQLRGREKCNKGRQ